MRNKSKLSSEGGDSGDMKYKWVYSSDYDGAWQNLRLTGVWSQAVDSVLV
jgi:hypothetical protein